MDMTTFDPQSGSSQPDPAPQPRQAAPSQYPTSYAGYGPPPTEPRPVAMHPAVMHPAAMHPAAMPAPFAGYPTPYPTGYPAPYQVPAPAKPSRRRRTLVSVGAAAVAAALVLGGYGIGSAVNGNDTVAGSASGGSGTSIGGNGGTALFPGGSGSDTRGNQGNGSSSQRAGTTATSTQQAGIVTINSVLKYQNAESAGTGMILTSDGEILTNNHVVDGATSVTVTDESTGKSYRADVVGTAPGSDVAVLQLRDASGLTTAKVGGTSDVSDVSVGDTVTGVGNANGTGTLTQVSGAVTALEQSITATDESGSNSEKLTGLIETNAAIVSGDSGGPLYDSDGDVVGINTAASSTNGSNTGAASQAYAIPIDDALKVADQIESGVETSAVHIGLPAFIGVGVGDDAGTGAAIASVLDGGPADDAGITTGSTITSIGGTAVTGADSLKTVLGTYQPGQSVGIAWTDAQGANHTATVKLVQGPAD